MDRGKRRACGSDWSMHILFAIGTFFLPMVSVESLHKDRRLYLQENVI